MKQRGFTIVVMFSLKHLAQVIGSEEGSVQSCMGIFPIPLNEVGDPGWVIQHQTVPLNVNSHHRPQ